MALSFINPYAKGAVAYHFPMILHQHALLHKAEHFFPSMSHPALPLFSEHPLRMWKRVRPFSTSRPVLDGDYALKD